MANYGDRARIGMLLPSVNRAAEPQITAMLPRGVALHTTRLRCRCRPDRVPLHGGVDVRARLR